MTATDPATARADTAARHDLYRRPVPLDPARHAGRRILPLADYRFAGGQHAAYLTVTEVPHAALEFPIVFVRTEPGGSHAGGLSPVVLLGLETGENLFVDPESGRWLGRYIPAALRRYPFITAQAVEGRPPQVLVDEAWAGFADDAPGEPLFEPAAGAGAAAAPAPALRRALDYLERFEQEVARTRAFCSRLGELAILEPMKVDATLPGERKLRVDGFEAVDENKLQKLGDATIVELFRTGMLGMLALHLASIANVRHVVDRKGARELADAAPGGSA